MRLAVATPSARTCSSLAGTKPLSECTYNIVISCLPLVMCPRLPKTEALYTGLWQHVPVRPLLFSLRSPLHHLTSRLRCCPQSPTNCLGIIMDMPNSAIPNCRLHYIAEGLFQRSALSLLNGLQQLHLPLDSESCINQRLTAERQHLSPRLLQRELTELGPLDYLGDDSGYVARQHLSDSVQVNVMLQCSLGIDMNQPTNSLSIRWQYVKNCVQPAWPYHRRVNALFIVSSENHNDISGLTINAINGIENLIHVLIALSIHLPVDVLAEYHTGG